MVMNILLQVGLKGFFKGYDKYIAEKINKEEKSNDGKADFEEKSNFLLKNKFNKPLESESMIKEKRRESKDSLNSPYKSDKKKFRKDFKRKKSSIKIKSMNIKNNFISNMVLLMINHKVQKIK